MVLRDWLLSLSMMFSRFNHVAVISLLRIHSMAIKAFVPQDRCTRMFIVEIFITIKKRKKKRKKKEKLEMLRTLMNRNGIHTPRNIMQ